MEKTVQVLDGIWQLKILGDNVYGIPQEAMDAAVTAKAFAQKVWIEGTDGDVWFSDNCFDMQAGERRVKIVRGNASGFKVRSVYDIA